MSVFAPFRFNPFNHWVYFPSWANEVSHDVPFEDGWSGELELELLARSEILIGGVRREPTETVAGEVWPFQLPDGKWAIPPSTLKGFLRTGVETVSFSKLLPFMDDLMVKEGGSKRAVSAKKALAKTPWHFSQQPDLATLIFGSVSEDSEAFAAKSRVSFDLAIAQFEGTVLTGPEGVLASPKPTYSPLYGLDPGTRDPIAGRKIWPASTLAGSNAYRFDRTNRDPKSQGNRRTVSRLNALPQGTRFTTRLRFHNLKLVELGALIFVLTASRIEDADAGSFEDVASVHRMGAGKPFGLGHVSILIKSHAWDPNKTNGHEKRPSPKDVAKLFAKHMQSKAASLEQPFDWVRSPQILTFRRAAEPQANRHMRLTYMRLGKGSVPGTYAGEKETGRLPDYLKEISSGQ
jgi:hypothetical protein